MRLSIILALLAAGCHSAQPGRLHVQSPEPGRYEIYRVVDQATVSESGGAFNREVPLPPGQYLVFADCSYQRVDVRAGELTTLYANIVEFVPPRVPDPEDQFAVQCARYRRFHSHQTTRDRYRFFLIAPSKDLLVGMTRLDISFAPDRPARQEFRLAAVRVEGADPGAGRARYFVSPEQSPVAITQSQRFGRWLYLLPGEYRITVNGTTQRVQLGPGERLSVTPGAVGVFVPPSVDLGRKTLVRGITPEVAVNGAHSLELNTLHAVLPGTLALKLDGSHRDWPLMIAGGQTRRLEARSLSIRSNCAAAEWECVGKREVTLYHKSNAYPLKRDRTDVPILFFDRGEPLFVELEGSTGVWLRLPAKPRDLVLEMGRLTIVPQLHYEPGTLTTVARVEPLEPGSRGYSHDLPAGRTTDMALLRGRYVLRSYTAHNYFDAAQQTFAREFTITKGRNIRLTVPFYVSEQRFQKAQRERRSPGPAEVPLDFG